MSMGADGQHHCDCCDTNLQAGGVAQCAIVSDLDPDRPGMVRNLHFCRDRVEEIDGARRNITGCASKLLTPEILAAYTTRQEAGRG